MNFPKDIREEKENTQDQVHSVVLRILKIVKQICKKHNISFWLEYGTLLGCIRHKGFIPWDHEADIGMLRTDYNKFLKIVKEELPEDLFFQTKESDPLYSSYYIIESKIRDRYSEYIEDRGKYLWHNGIQVDIFVYDLDIERTLCLTNSFERNFSKGNIHLKVEEIQYLISGLFEETEFPIPIGYENYLKRAYGNYMQLPPITERQFPKVNVFSSCNHIESLDWNSKKN